MDLTEGQKDSLAELINIGYGRAAAALSELTGYRITLEAPRVAMYAIDEVGSMLSGVVDGEVASVNQVFSGPISGNALLLLDQRAALVLSQLLTNETPAIDGFDANAREVITEVGNIVLNACLGVFGNMLHIDVSFAVPRMRVDGVRSVLRSITIGAEELQYALMIHTRFHLRESNVAGYLVIILGITSLDQLLAELVVWEQRQNA